MSDQVQKLRKEAQVKAAKGDLGGALSAYQGALKFAPNDARLWVNIGDICLKLGQKKEAVQIYEKAANQYAAQGDLKQAVSVTQAIINAAPRYEKAKKQLRILQSRVDIAKASDGGDTVAQWYHDKEHGNPGGGVSLSGTEAMVHDESVIEFDEQTGDNQSDSENIFEFADRVRDEDRDEDTLALTGAVHSDIMDQDIDHSSPQERIRRLIGELQDVPIFSELTSDEIAALSDSIKMRTFDPGEVIIAEGSQGDAFFILASGSASVSKKDPAGIPVGLTVLHHGNFFGEFGFITGQPRSATVTAFDECRVMAFSKSALEQIIRDHPRINQVLDNFYRRRLIDTTVAISPIFRMLGDDVRGKLIEKLDTGVIPPGTILCEQGKSAPAVFIVVSGEVDVTIQTNDGIVRASPLTQGHSFGEISFITGEPLPASYATATESRILKVSAPVFEQILSRFEAVKESARTLAEDRIRDYQRLSGG